MLGVRALVKLTDHVHDDAHGLSATRTDGTSSYAVTGCKSFHIDTYWERATDDTVTILSCAPFETQEAIAMTTVQRVAPFLIAVAICTMLLTPLASDAAGGDLLWQATFDLAAAIDQAVAVAAADGRVVAVGNALNAAGNSDFIVRAYNAKTGAPLWNDRVDLTGGADAAKAVVMDDQLVVVAGIGVGAAGSELILRVYDARTGGLRWRDQFPASVVGGLAMDKRRIVVAGGTENATNTRVPFVRAYAAKSGVVLWEDRTIPAGYDLVGPGNPGLDDRGLSLARLVAMQGEIAFVAATLNLQGPPDFSRHRCLTRAYDVPSGHLLWESISGDSCRARAIATDGRRVMVGGSGTASIEVFQVRSYDAETGQELWRGLGSVSSPSMSVEAAVAVDLERRRAFVAGSIEASAFRRGPGDFFVVRAYDPETGDLQWEDLFAMPPGCECHARDVVAANGHVFVVGNGGNPFDRTNQPTAWFVRAYDAVTGAVLWHEEGAATGQAEAVATAGGRVFVAGSALNAQGDIDFIVRAYDAK